MNCQPVHVPDEVWVIIRSMGEYSDRSETPIRFCLSEKEAQQAVELITVEKQRDTRPKYRSEPAYGFHLPDGSWSNNFMDSRTHAAKFERRPDADLIEAQNDLWRTEYEAAVAALGHVDPGGSWSGDEYYIAQVTLWRPASADTHPEGQDPAEGLGS